VDEMGNLDHTIAKAAELAGIKDYRTASYPRIKDPLYQFLEELTGEDYSATIKWLRGNPSDMIHNKLTEELKAWSVPQARMPVNIIWE